MTLCGRPRQFMIPSRAGFCTPTATFSRQRPLRGRQEDATNRPESTVYRHRTHGMRVAQLRRAGEW